MLTAIPSQPGVFDLNHDRFADIVLVGDAGGKVWKWDISAKGVDSDADPQVDNWTFGTFFHAAPASVGGGQQHYKSFFYPPSAAYLNGQLIYVFATGERKDLLFIGDAAYDENNRIYVIRDPNPIGASSIPATAYTEADLTNVTSSAADGDPTDLGYFVVAPDGEKFITDLLIFSGHVILASYNPDSFPACGPGEAYLYTFRLANGLGYYDANATPEAADRRYAIGTGIPSTPRISVSPNPSDDIGFINTSDKKVLTFDPPGRDAPESSVLYWRQRF
jgi:type IV pilus assembly protein PilY1